MGGAQRGHRSSGLTRRQLAVAVLAANVALLNVLTAAIGSLLVAKVVTELVLFAASYLVQRRLVF
jgi:hypothetical protein